MMDDLLGLGGGGGDNNGNVRNSSSWSLIPDPTVDQATFQAQWEALPQATHMDLPLSSCPSAEKLESLAKQNNIACMASGDLGSELKFYFFARDNANALYLSEVVL